jgi:hypothetical protein
MAFPVSRAEKCLFRTNGTMLLEESHLCRSFQNDVQSETNFCPISLHLRTAFPSIICPLDKSGRRLRTTWTYMPPCSPCCPVPTLQAALHHFSQSFLTAASSKIATISDGLYNPPAVTTAFGALVKRSAPQLKKRGKKNGDALNKWPSEKIMSATNCN